MTSSNSVAPGAAILGELSPDRILRVTGETRLDLIHRISTQDVTSLRPGSGAATVLVTSIGRFIDRLILYVFADHLLLLCGDGNGENVANYLRRNVFFRDDFHVEAADQTHSILLLAGEGARSILEDLSGLDLDLGLHHWLEVTIGSDHLLAARTDPIVGDAYLLLVSPQNKDIVAATLTAAGAAIVGEQELEYHRIEAGLARFGHEITPDYIPLEAGMWNDISFKKGCYTGQEIIARMESRGKLSKRLVRISSNELLHPGSEIVTDASKVVGVVTSASDGPAGPLALAYVKSSALDSNTSLQSEGLSLRLVE